MEEGQTLKLFVAADLCSMGLWPLPWITGGNGGREKNLPTLLIGPLVCAFELASRSRLPSISRTFPFPIGYSKSVNNDRERSIVVPTTTNPELSLWTLLVTMTTPPLASRLVNVAEDAELRLISLLGEYSPTLNVAQCEECGDTSELFQMILADKASVPALVTQIQDSEEAVGGFALLVALISDQETSPTQADVSALAKAVVEAGDTTEATCARRLRLLSVLYNLRAPVLEKLEVLQHMITVAGNFPGRFLRVHDPLGNMLVADDEKHETGSDGSVTGSSSTRLSLYPSKPRLVEMLDSWNISTERRLSLYQTIVQAFEAKAPNDIRKQRFLLLMVECSSKSRDAIVATASESAAIGVIRDPISLFAHQRNILDFPSIQALADKQPVLFGLLKIFQEGKLSDYDAFLQGNGGEEAILSRWGLDASLCRRNMRILSLCSLAAEHEEIPYANIASTLQIDGSNKMQVEAQVIAAVNSGLLQAKMDQLSQKVLVERCVVRKFDMPQWKAIQERLRVWKENVGSILKALEEARNSATPISDAT